VRAAFSREKNALFRPKGSVLLFTVSNTLLFKREHSRPPYRSTKKWNFRVARTKIVTPHRKQECEASLAKAKKKKPPFDVKSFLSTMDGGRTVQTFRKDQKVFAQGDRADAVFYIQEGKVKVFVISEQGKEAVVALHGKGDFFGERCLTGQPVRLATVSAMTDCVIMRIDKADMVRTLRDEPKLSEVFMAYILARNARVEEDLVDQLFNSSEKRLARVLLLMANFGKEGKPEPVIPKISQETLAEIVGTTRSRVSTFMNRFRELGFIHYNGDLEVHNSLLNVVLHDKPHIRGDSEK
jgi:CRP/FNR family transcriptional regulator, cyclic AMP receptor protein